MSDLIRRQDALSCFHDWIDKYGDVHAADEITEYRMIERLASVEPEPERTGKWQITHAYPHNVHCSVCHKRFAQTHWAVWEDGTLPRNFCPNCGARMVKEGEEHD